MPRKGADVAAAPSRLLPAARRTEAGKLAFCIAFFVLGIVGVMLCLEAGAWFIGLIMIALTGRMAYGVFEALGLAGDPRMWAHRRRRLAAAHRYAGAPGAAALADELPPIAARRAQRGQRKAPKRAEPHPGMRGGRPRPRARASAK